MRAVYHRDCEHMETGYTLFESPNVHVNGMGQVVDDDRDLALIPYINVLDLCMIGLTKRWQH